MAPHNYGLFGPRYKRPDWRTFSPYAGPLVRRRAAQGALLQNVGEVLVKVTGLTSFAMTDIVNEAMVGASGELHERLTVFTRALKYKANRRVGMLKMHDRIGKKAQLAVLESYGRERLVSAEYRDRPGRLAGKLLPALQDKNFYIPQPDGLLFANGAMLDRKAAHWYRLNFGAGLAGTGGKKARSYPVRFDGQNVGVSLTLSRFGPSAPFDMPLGVFVRGNNPVKPAYGLVDSSGTRDEFITWSYLKGHNPPKDFKRNRVMARPTFGIYPERWLDAGLNSMSRTIPLEYMALLGQWALEAVEEGKGPISKLI